MNLNPLRECANSLQQTLHTFSERLEAVRERIEGATRLHHLIGLQLKEDDVLHEMQLLAEKIGKPDLLERFNQNVSAFAMGNASSRAAAALKIDVKRLFNTSTPERPTSNSQPKLQVRAASSKSFECPSPDSYISWLAPVAVTGHVEETHEMVSLGKANSSCSKPSTPETESPHSSLVQGTHVRQHDTSLGSSSGFGMRSTAHEEDEEDHSKIADSGLGGCDRCEGQDAAKMKRACSCQSFEDATMMTKGNDSDDMDEDEDECFGRNAKAVDHGIMSFQPNSHLFSHSSSLNMDLEAEVPGIDQKTQK